MGRNARDHPLVALSTPQLAVLANEVLEDVDPAGARGFPKPLQDLPYALLPADRLAEETLGGKPDRLQDGVTALQLPPRPPQIMLLPSLLQAPLYDRTQPGEVVLHHVVVCPSLYRPGRYVLPDLPGDHDERCFRIRGVPHLQRLRGVHSLVLGLVAAAPELAQQQEGVVLGVLDEQHAQRRAVQLRPFR